MDQWCEISILDKNGKRYFRETVAYEYHSGILHNKMKYAQRIANGDKWFSRLNIPHDNLAVIIEIDQQVIESFSLSSADTSISDEELLKALED